MRKLKFRIWDKWNNRFWYCNEWEDDNYDQEYFGSYHNSFQDSLRDLQKNEDRYCIQQFTGLLDSKEKEIYEGDIIEDSWKENQPYGYSPDDWDNREQIYSIKYEPPSFVFHKYRHSQNCIQNFKREVIGNIFENPELIV